MFVRRVHVRVMMSLVWCIILAGCSSSAEDQLPRQPVSGTVTVDDKPLKDGSITFTPDDLGRSDAVTAGAVITEGSYTIPKQGGPTPGKYRVAILGADEAPPPSKEAPGMPTRPSPTKKPIVPEKYNAKSTLTAEVKNGERNTIDFELKSQ